MPNSKLYARDEQAFVKALQEAINNRDEREAARLVSEHTAELEAFLERMLGELDMLGSSTLH